MNACVWAERERIDSVKLGNKIARQQRYNAVVPQGGQTESRQLHKLEEAGSTPAPAANEVANG